MQTRRSFFRTIVGGFAALAAGVKAAPAAARRASRVFFDIPPGRGYFNFPGGSTSSFPALKRSGATIVSDIPQWQETMVKQLWGKNRFGEWVLLADLPADANSVTLDDQNRVISVNRAS